MFIQQDKFSNNFQQNIVIMKFENFILEVFGIVYPAAMVYAVNMHFPLAPLFPVLNEQDNLIRTCGIASAIYLIGRIYYGVIFFVTSKITHKRAGKSIYLLSFISNFRHFDSLLVQNK